MTLGEQIKHNREGRNLSQEELAERIGVSRQAVSKWESDRAVPTGTNRRTLCQVLDLDLPESDAPKAARRGRLLCIAGWGAAAILLAALLWRGVWFHRVIQMPAAADASLLSIHFYDEKQDEVFPEALWYNAAQMESILIQWTGCTPEAVKMFYTPSGTETMEKTELLAIKAPADGEMALLLSARPLKKEALSGHVYFELDFGGGHIVTTDDLYNVFYNPDAPE